MLPPFLFSLGGKIGMGLLSAALVAGAIYAYNARQQSIGYHEAKEEIHEQIQEQTERVKAHDEIQAESRIEGLERMLAAKDAFHAALARENRQLKAKLVPVTPNTPEVRHDVPFIEITQDPEPREDLTTHALMPCVVPDELVDRVDELARVLNAIPYNRVPDGGEAAGEPAVQGFAPVACAALLDRIEALPVRLGTSLIEHRSLSEQVVKEYELSEAFQKEQAR